jgi:hypothetical protein
VNHGQRLVANFLKSCLKFYFEVLLVVVLAASQTLLASATDCGNVAPGAVPPAEPDYLGAELQELDVGSVKSLGFEHALLVGASCPEWACGQGRPETRRCHLGLEWEAGAKPR